MNLGMVQRLYFELFAVFWQVAFDNLFAHEGLDLF